MAGPPSVLPRTGLVMRAACVMCAIIATQALGLSTASKHSATQPRRGLLQGDAPLELERINYKDSAFNRMLQRPLCFEELRNKYLVALNKVVPEDRQAVLLGVRESDDQVGDSIMWLGEALGVFHSLVHLVAQCLETDHDCATTAMGMLPKDGIVLFHGRVNLRGRNGGGSPLLSADTVKQMELAWGRRVVFLPQPLYYESPEDAKEDLEALQALNHTDAHLLVTSATDAAFAKELFPGVFASVEVIPCSAVNVGHMQLTNNRTGPAKVDVKYWRQEKGQPGEAWADLKSMLQKLIFMPLTFENRYPVKVGQGDPLAPPSSLATMQLALQRATAHGRPFTTARAIITNDLDMVLLGTLVDVPVVSSEDGSTKIIESMATIYEGSERCGLGLRHFTADSISDASRIVKVLLGVEKPVE